MASISRVRSVALTVIFCGGVSVLVRFAQGNVTNITFPVCFAAILVLSYKLELQ